MHNLRNSHADSSASVGGVGALAAISHDEQFIQALDPTHIARVHPDGSVVVDLCINGDIRPPQPKNPPAAAPGPSSATLKAGKGSKPEFVKNAGHQDRKRLQQVGEARL